MAYLNKTQVASFEKQGYLLVKNYASNEEVKSLKKRIHQIIETLHIEQVKIFTTENQAQHLDEYFLNSADKIRCFFEEKAFDKNGQIQVNIQQAINKIGHALHDRDRVFEAFSYSNNFYQITQDLSIAKPSIIQSQYIFKQANIGAKVNPHMDSTFLLTQPHSCIGIWVALEDSCVENGCLCAIPSSHKTYGLGKQYVKALDNTGTKFVELQKAAIPEKDWELSKMIPLEAKKGDLILLHGELVHASYPNRSSYSRHSYILHIVDQNATWSPHNWLQRPISFPFRDMKTVVNTFNSL